MSYMKKSSVLIIIGIAHATISDPIFRFMDHASDLYSELLQVSTTNLNMNEIDPIISTLGNLITQSRLSVGTPEFTSRIAYQDLSANVHNTLYSLLTRKELLREHVSESDNLIRFYWDHLILDNQSRERSITVGELIAASLMRTGEYGEFQIRLNHMFPPKGDEDLLKGVINALMDTHPLVDDLPAIVNSVPGGPRWDDMPILDRTIEVAHNLQYELFTDIGDDASLMTFLTATLYLFDSIVDGGQVSPGSREYIMTEICNGNSQFINRILRSIQTHSVRERIAFERFCLPALNTATRYSFLFMPYITQSHAVPWYAASRTEISLEESSADAVLVAIGTLSIDQI